MILDVNEVSRLRHSTAFPGGFRNAEWAMDSASAPIPGDAVTFQNGGETVWEGVVVLAESEPPAGTVYLTAIGYAFLATEAAAPVAPTPDEPEPA